MRGAKWGCNSRVSKLTAWAFVEKIAMPDSMGHDMQVIHDVCQSYIRSDKPMPNTNDCSDEGYHAAGAAALTTGLGYNCLA